MIGTAKINQLDVESMVLLQQDVFRFHITVDDTVFVTMDVTKGAEKLRFMNRTKPT